MKKMKFSSSPETEAAAPADASLGRRLRVLRKAGGLSLQQVAGRTGLSIGYLSQVERGVSSASVRALAIIAEGLGVGLAGLFSTQAPSDEARFGFRSDESQVFNIPFDGVEKRLLTPGTQSGGLNLFLMTIAPGGNSGDAFYHHAGEEAGHIQAGTLELTVDTETRLLKTGDSFRFLSARPHRWRNAGRGVCKVLWVNNT
jgi:transcriptional regulator with XRE-family HTH domain